MSPCRLPEKVHPPSLPGGLGAAVVSHLLRISRFLRMRRSQHHVEPTLVSQAGAHPASGGSSYRGLMGPLGQVGGEVAGSESRGGHRCPSGALLAMPLRAFFLSKLPPSLILCLSGRFCDYQIPFIKFLFHSKSQSWIPLQFWSDFRIKTLED